MSRHLSILKRLVNGIQSAFALYTAMKSIYIIFLENMLWLLLHLSQIYLYDLHISKLFSHMLRRRTESLDFVTCLLYSVLHVSLSAHIFNKSIISSSPPDI